MGTIRLSRTVYPVTVLGFGRRLGIWLQGCPLACPGCMSRDTWDPLAGRDVQIEDLVGRWEAALRDGADGLTVSGGEPLTQPEALGELLSRVDEARRRLAGTPADVLVYTGYEPDELSREQQAALAHADAVMTGRYDVTLPTEQIWRGSDNQRMWLRTALGRDRYGDLADAVNGQPAMQAHLEEGQVLLIGIPRRGDLARLERGLRATGVPVAGVSWRPPVDDGEPPSDSGQAASVA
ncbi:4Fe-4S single cluster domain-containing protein [Micromonospora arida]|uniref:4Fe-4S single cluster domain-containing protein n=1 Tax=Micromonospora arida TaxID=2203715 RepID=UPI003CE8459C